MKYIYALLTALLLTGCGYLKNDTNIEFTGTAPAIKSGVVIIKDPSQKTVYGTNIKAGSFHIVSQPLEHTGYYTLEITDDSNKKEPNPVEIYLEPGKYNIEVKKAAAGKYPLISSSSKIQNELSAYYKLSDSLSYKKHHKADSLIAKLNSKNSYFLSPDAYNDLVKQVKEAQNQATISNADILAVFAKKYPQNEIAAHLMIGLNYENEAAAYYKTYQTLSPEVKNSPEGQEVGETLNHLIKLVPGALAPAIYGNTPDGKPFDLKTIHKKVILLSFWRSGDSNSRNNNVDINNNFKNQIPFSSVGIVSFSFDTQRDHWTTAIEADKMNWPQVSDLKGDDSPNATNWGIKTMPTYYVLDSGYHIIEGDVSYSRLAFVINDYLKKHH